ncbi:MAG: exo-alpha-sialidase [Chloroflexi bacterium]|nr:exo-alpha-sialidase [Chloroflexota bacterium]
MTARIRLLVGTKKGAFIYTADEDRSRWQIGKPIYTGWSVAHMAADCRDGAVHLYAAATHWAWGPSVAKSLDGGDSWDYRSTGLAFPQDSGKSITSVWQVQPGLGSEPGVVYAGVQPAGLFRSEDWGRTWAPVSGLNDHEQAPTWAGTGGGESCLNSIQIDPADPRHMWVAISAGGSYETRDAGASWALFSHTAIPTNERGRAFSTDIAKLFPDAPAPRRGDIDPLAIDEMHKMLLDPKDASELWTQSHVGVFRSADGGRTWQDVTGGLPSFHGFPIAISKKPPDAVYVVPLAFADLYDNFRVCDGQFAVYRSRDKGATWQALTEGLPGPHDYQSVYREGLDTDPETPGGVYVGTSNGEVYASMDAGDHWRRLPGTLPPILSVTAAAW